MNHEIQDLARRAMACKNWRWMPGMLLDSPQFDRPVRYLLGMDHGDCFEHEWASRWNNGDGGKLPLGAYPVLSDPATLGCVLALLLEVNQPSNEIRLPININAVDAVSLVAALEAAP